MLAGFLSLISAQRREKSFSFKYFRQYYAIKWWLWHLVGAFIGVLASYFFGSCMVPPSGRCANRAYWHNFSIFGHIFSIWHIAICPNRHIRAYFGHIYARMSIFMPIWAYCWHIFSIPAYWAYPHILSLSMPRISLRLSRSFVFLILFRFLALDLFLPTFNWCLVIYHHVGATRVVDLNIFFGACYHLYLLPDLAQHNSWFLSYYRYSPTLRT